MTSFRIRAVRASLGGFPAAMRRSGLEVWVVADPGRACKRAAQRGAAASDGGSACPLAGLPGHRGEAGEACGLTGLEAPELGGLDQQRRRRDV